MPKSKKDKKREKELLNEINDELRNDYSEKIKNFSIEELEQLRKFIDYYGPDDSDCGNMKIDSYLDYLIKKRKIEANVHEKDILKQLDILKDYGEEIIHNLEDISSDFSFTNVKIDGLEDFYAPYCFWDKIIIPDNKKYFHSFCSKLKQSINKLLTKNEELNNRINELQEENEQLKHKSTKKIKIK